MYGTLKVSETRPLDFCFVVVLFSMSLSKTNETDYFRPPTEPGYFRNINS